MLVEGPVDPNKLESEDGLNEEHQKDSAREKRSAGARMGGDASPFAMDNRDPNHLNQHVQVMWDDIIGEPEGLRTPDGCWNCSNKCYDGTRRCCYVLMAILCAPFVAFCSGLCFACLAFNNVWCIGPHLRMCKMNLAIFKKYWETCLKACCYPVAEMCGVCCSKAKVRYQRIPDAAEPQEVDYFHV